MRIALNLTLDCSADAAWEGVTSPSGLTSVSAPLLGFRSLDEGGFTDRWSEGEHEVEMRALDLIPVGRQIIAISFHTRGDSRIVRDAGRGLTWPLTLTTYWNHRMEVSPRADGRTDFRDRLEFRAGILSPVLWVGYWVFWQWRARGIIRAARHW
ncbi:MAG: hypothetical protein ACOH1J_06585 [Microbacteriaceae bacterium]